MEYEEESVHNAPTAARNAVVSVAKKVEDNVLHVMTAPVVTPPSTAPTTPEADSPGVLPKGAQRPGHQVGTHAFREAQGG